VFFFYRLPHVPTNEGGCYGNYYALAGRNDIVQPVNNQGVKRWHSVNDKLINPSTVFNTTTNNITAFDAYKINLPVSSLLTDETKLREQGLLPCFIKPAGGAHTRSRNQRPGWLRDVSTVFLCGKTHNLVTVK